MKLLRRAHKLIASVAHVLAIAGTAGLLLLAAMVCLDIAMRSTFDFSIQGVNDVYAVVIAVAITACIPNALIAKQNIAVEMLGQYVGGRFHTALQVLASSALLLFMVLMAYEFIPYAASKTASGEKTWVLHLPVGPWWWATAVLMWFGALTQAAVWMEDLAQLFTSQHSPNNVQGAHNAEDIGGSI